MKNYHYDLQGARATITINILHIRKLIKNHLITKNTMFALFDKAKPVLFDEF